MTVRVTVTVMFRGNWSDSKRDSDSTGVTVRVIVTVTPRAEYKLYISAADSPRFTWIKGR